ncbi:class I SAM-dependent methyltransferase [Paludisphaera sp.]|uniref:class I SAM-dependent methyltransferase n=1 Tax=Paludisphaera sp. TaxID=2017432 RepID=UPI00301CA11F
MRNCPICAHASAEPWLLVPDIVTSSPSRGAYELFRCRDCDYGFVDPRPTPEEARGFYPDNYYTHAPNGRPAGGRLPFPDRLLHNLAWRFDRSVPMTDALGRYCAGRPRVCDIGCGSGKLLGLMRDAGADVVGVEIDEKARNTARSLGLEVYAGTAEQLPPEVEPGTFDLVWMCHVLEHCIDPVAGLASVSGLLKPSGRLVVEVPNNECLGMQRSGIAWRWLDVPRHLNFFTRKSLTGVCRLAGLEVETVEFSGYGRQFHPVWAAAEERLRLAFAAANAAASTGASTRGVGAPSRWSLLLATAGAQAGRKYDSVRVTVRRPA